MFNIGKYNIFPFNIEQYTDDTLCSIYNTNSIISTNKYINSVISTTISLSSVITFTIIKTSNINMEPILRTSNVMFISQNDSTVTKIFTAISTLDREIDVGSVTK